MLFLLLVHEIIGHVRRIVKTLTLVFANIFAKFSFVRLLDCTAREGTVERTAMCS